MIFLDRASNKQVGKVRLMHAIPNAPSVDVYANNDLLYSNLSFGNVTNYLEVPAGNYRIDLYKSGSKSSLLITENYEVDANTANTVAVTLENNEISFFVVDDTHKVGNKALASVRFINLSSNAPLMSLSIPEGDFLFNNVSYLETNNYYPISPGIYNFVVTSNDGLFQKYISEVDLKGGMYITIYIIGVYRGTPKLGYILLKDN